MLASMLDSTHHNDLTFKWATRLHLHKLQGIAGRPAQRCHGVLAIQDQALHEPVQWPSWSEVLVRRPESVLALMV